MFVKTVGMREGFVTNRTHKGLVPCVFSTVYAQVTGMGEGLVTGGAGKGLIACVTLQVTRVRESLATMGAGIWFCPGVNSHVSPQVC